MVDIDPFARTKQHLAGAKVSGGVSNVSFSFRRNDPVRWRPGEREALIAEALAKGRVTQVPRGQSAYTQDSAQQRSFGTLPSIR